MRKGSRREEDEHEGVGGAGGRKRNIREKGEHEE